MSEVARASTALELDGLLAQVEALRCTVEPRLDPVRLRFIEALSRRLQAAPPALQKVLKGKLTEALKALGGDVENDSNAQSVAQPVANETIDASNGRPEPVEALAPAPASRKPRAKVPAHAAPPAAPLSLLGQLNQHIQTASLSKDAAGNGNAAQALKAQTQLQELKSAVRFRETWARISAETEVDQAKIRAPENAGPLNAHNLVLRTLALMRELSPDYLRRFMGHTESLLWLDQAYGQLKQPAGKARSAKLAKPKH
jgi:DNA polymerase III gamma/tau subunit